MQLLFQLAHRETLRRQPPTNGVFLPAPRAELALHRGEIALRGRAFGGRGGVLALRLRRAPLRLDALIAGRLAPLLSVSEGRIDAIVPYDVPPNTSLQLLVLKGTVPTLPEPVNTAPAQPAIFTKDKS